MVKGMRKWLVCLVVIGFFAQLVSSFANHRLSVCKGKGASPRWEVGGPSGESELFHKYPAGGGFGPAQPRKPPIPCIAFWPTTHQNSHRRPSNLRIIAQQMDLVAIASKLNIFPSFLSKVCERRTRIEWLTVYGVQWYPVCLCLATILRVISEKVKWTDSLTANSTSWDSCYCVVLFGPRFRKCEIVGGGSHPSHYRIHTDTWDNLAICL